MNQIINSFKVKNLEQTCVKSLMFITNQGPMYEWNHIHKCKNLYFEEVPHDSGQHCKTKPLMLSFINIAYPTFSIVVNI